MFFHNDELNKNLNGSIYHAKGISNGVGKIPEIDLLIPVQRKLSSNMCPKNDHFTSVLSE